MSNILHHYHLFSQFSLSGLRVLSLILSAYLLCSGGASWSQETTPPATIPKNTSPAPTENSQEIPPVPLPGSNVPTQVPQDILFLPDAEGRLKPVPVNVTLEEYLDWLDQRDTLATTDQSEWLIRSLECAGGLKIAANGNPWASLTCQLELEVGQSPRWHSLPLMMGEGLLAGLTDSEEETASSQVMVSRDTDSGQWLLWYRNRKSFQLTLEILVPVRVVGDQRQLVLTLPTASRTELQLQIDQPNLMVDLHSRGFWEKEQNDAGTLVRVAGFQQNVDLTWSQERQDSEMPPIMHVDSQIELSCSSESSLILARQKITLDRGLLNLLRVKLPAGFQVDDVRSDVPMKYAIEASDPSSITLNFSQPVQTAVQIDWKLSSPLRRDESQIHLEGFVVEGARTQTGKIGILKSHEWRIGQNPSRSENIYLMNVRDFPMMGEYALAYRYYGQPYQLNLNTQRNASQYNQSAYYQLQVAEESLKMTVDFEISPRNRVIDSIRIDWPDLNSGAWIPEKIIRQSTGQAVIWQIEGDDKLLLPLPNLDGQEIIRLEASRKIPPVSELLQSGQPLSLMLPQISMAESTVQERVLKLCNSHFLPWETLLAPSPAAGITSSEAPAEEWTKRPLFQQKSPRDHRIHWYRLGSTAEPLSLQFAPIARELKASSHVELEQIDLKNRRLSYTQKIQLHVGQLPLSKIVLLGQSQQPLEEVLQGLRFTDRANNPLTPQISSIPIDAADPSEETSTGQRLLYRLEFQPETPILGDFQLLVHRDMALSSLESLDAQKFELPLLQLSGVENMPNHFVNRSAYLVELAQSAWQLVEVQGGEPIWRTSKTINTLAFQANFRRSRSMDETGLVKTQVQTWMSGEGVLLTEIRFQLPRTPPAFMLQPADASELVSVVWNPAKPQAENLLIPLQTLQQANETTVLFPEEAIGEAGELVLSLRHEEQPLLSSLRNYQLLLPEHSLSSDVTLMQWTLNLPQGVYLFSPPAGFNADYQWAWQGLGIRRIPTTPVGLAPHSSLVTGQHPAYHFSSVGWPDRMDVRLIGRGLLMTLGTGIPILIAVLFAGRSYEYRLRGGLLLVLLGGAFAIAAPESFVVLLQPALLGTLFILAATWVAHQMRRHQEEPTLIIVGPTVPGEPVGSEVANFSDHGVGADDITRVQPPRKSALESSHL